MLLSGLVTSDFASSQGGKRLINGKIGNDSKEAHIHNN
jgi:hypothetical protein